MLVVDSGPLVAAANVRDRHHASCTELLRRAPQPLSVPALVVTEVAYFLGDRIGPEAELAFARSFEEGELTVVPVEPVDWSRVAELVERYADLPLGIVDASVIVACERLEADTLATLDRRHFGIVRPRHVPELRLVPEA